MLASRQFGALGASAALLLLAAGAGLAAAVQPTLGIGLAFGIVFALITLSDVTAGLILFTALSFLDVLTNTGGALAGFAKVAGGLLFGSWYARRLVGEPRVAATAPRLAPGLTVCLVVLAAWSALSVVWAQDPNVAISSTMSFVLNMLLFPIVLVAVQRREQLIRVMGAFVAGAVLSTAYGLAQPAAVGAGDYGRLTGSLGDANDQAAVLVAAIPLAIGLALAVKQPWARNLALLGGAVCVLGLINTLSRGGLVALGAVLVSAVVFGGRWRAKALLLLVLGSAGTVAYFALVAPGAARDRVTMASSSGRADLWRVGWRIVAAHPFNGVGSGNFQGAAVHYVQTAGILTSAYLIVDVPHVAHNAYLEVLADLGVPGLVPFLGIALFSLFASAQAARAFQREGDAQLEVLARSLVLAVVGLLTADFFLSGQFSKQLWLTFALCAAAPGISRRDPNAGSGFTRG